MPHETSPPNMIEIDGSFGEGGGQILRTTLALAAVLRQDVKVVKIRAGRPKPGLMAQHLTGVHAAAVLCDAETSGEEVGSEELVFKHGRIRAGNFRFDVGTAGSVALVLQALMPILAFAPGRVELEIIGGTDVKWSPPVDYLSMVELPILENLGYHGHLELLRRGHYPRGGGLVRFVNKPSQGLRSITTESEAKVSGVEGVSHAVRLPSHIAKRQADSAVQILLANGYPRPNIRLEVSENGTHLGPGSGIVLVARTAREARLGSDSLGDRGVTAESVGKEAAKMLVEDLSTDCFFDRHMADIIVPYLVLAEGKSDVSIARVTNHVETNLAVAEQVAGIKFQLEGDLDKPGRIRLGGLGLKPQSSDAVSPIA
jgi:RNA 3'-terminal phosphate cyclase (ATP)